jgi:uncharacterized protein YndB with AHSA1/START domain
MADTQTDILEREIRIAAQPETIFAFFVDPAKLMLWIATEVTADARPGGMYRMNISDYVARGEYLEIVPSRRVVFTWGWENEITTPPPGGSTVEISLIPEGATTLVRLRHLGLNAEEHKPHGEGWDYFLSRLVLAAEGRAPESNQAADLLNM